MLKSCVTISTQILKLREDQEYEDEDDEDDDDDDENNADPTKSKEFNDTLEAHI